MRLRSIDCSSGLNLCRGLPSSNMMLCMNEGKSISQDVEAGRRYFSLGYFCRTVLTTGSHQKHLARVTQPDLIFDELKAPNQNPVNKVHCMLCEVTHSSLHISFWKSCVFSGGQLRAWVAHTMFYTAFCPIGCERHDAYVYSRL